MTVCHKGAAYFPMVRPIDRDAEISFGYYLFRRLLGWRFAIRYGRVFAAESVPSGRGSGAILKAAGISSEIVAFGNMLR